MKKTILIPTDFTIESLKMVKTVLANIDNAFKYEVVFLHGIHLSDSITDSYFFSRRKLIHILTNNSFEVACEVLKNKFTMVQSIRKDIFTGITQSAFEIYLEANNISEAYIPVDYELKQVNKNSFDLIHFIKHSELTVHEVQWNISENNLENGNFAELFFSASVK